ncbi:hypothetical protein EYF80_021176 [Liparis tanakae]|uniref:Uncharacterized protein n=1 Tax=Liparis tanakae TaxID=230148 RepID=A0A4Z2HSB2_9TELE|nr:hypothetical protein EYF80_021176 [Liparis tanakae]
MEEGVGGGFLGSSWGFISGGFLGPSRCCITLTHAAPWRVQRKSTEGPGSQSCFIKSSLLINDHVGPMPEPSEDDEDPDTTKKRNRREIFNLHLKDDRKKQNFFLEKLEPG